MKIYEVIILCSICSFYQYINYNAFSKNDNADEIYSEFLRINIFTRKFFATTERYCGIEKGPFCLLGTDPLSPKALFEKLNGLFAKNSHTQFLLMVDFESQELFVSKKIKIKSIIEIILRFSNAFISPNSFFDTDSTETQFYAIRNKMLNEILHENEIAFNYSTFFKESLFDHFDESIHFPSKRFLISKKGGATISFEPAVKLRGLYFKNIDFLSHKMFIQIKNESKLLQNIKISNTRYWKFLRFPLNVLCDELTFSEGLAIDTLSFYPNIEVSEFSIFL